MVLRRYCCGCENIVMLLQRLLNKIFAGTCKCLCSMIYYYQDTEIGKRTRKGECNMPIIIDIEWTETSYTNQPLYRKLTQLSALRVDNAWKKQDRLDLLVRPGAPKSCDWSFMAYNGHMAEEFCNGKSEGDCIKMLFAWVEKGERIFYWQSDTRKVLLKIYRRYFQDEERIFDGSRFVCIKEHLAAVLKKPVGGLYETALDYGIGVVSQHCSAPDVNLMQQILYNANISAKRLEKTPIIELDAAQRRLKNQKSISKMSCPFVYTPKSIVFHRCDCKLILSAIDVRGSAYYSTAARGRRPCKVCKPVVTAADIEKEKYHKAATALFDMNEVVKVRLIDGTRVEIKRKNIVGCCHNKIHPGRLNEKLMLQHNCPGKQCYYFEQYENASYWIEKRIRQREKQYINQQKQQHQKQEREAAQALDELKRFFQACMDGEGYPVRIVRLEPVKPNVYKVFYVSDYPFADGNLYPGFYISVAKQYSRYRMLMRHIQDENGHFVTRAEYIRRVGAAATD